MGLISGAQDGKCALGDYQKATLVDEIVRKLMMKYYPNLFQYNKHRFRPVGIIASKPSVLNSPTTLEILRASVGECRKERQEWRPDR